MHILQRKTGRFAHRIVDQARPVWDPCHAQTCVIELLAIGVIMGLQNGAGIGAHAY